MQADTSGPLNHDGSDEGPDEHIDPVTFFNGKLRDAIEGLTSSLKLCSEDELYNQVEPTANDWNLRRNFHAKVLEAQLAGDKVITTTSIYDGIVTRQFFFEKILASPLKIAWISRPLIEHNAYYLAIHNEGLRKILEFVRTATVTEKNATMISKLVEKAGDRVHGAVAQKMQIQSKNLNVDVTASQLPSPQGSVDIQNRITQLQDKLLDTGGIKDVTPSSDTSEDPS